MLQKKIRSNNQEMKREEYNNTTNQDLTKIMEKSATNKNTENTVNPCGCTHTHTHTHTHILFN